MECGGWEEMRGRARVCRAGEGSKRRSRVAVCVLVGAVGRAEIGGRKGVLAVAVMVAGIPRFRVWNPIAGGDGRVSRETSWCEEIVARSALFLFNYMRPVVELAAIFAAFGELREEGAMAVKIAWHFLSPSIIPDVQRERRLG